MAEFDSLTAESIQAITGSFDDLAREQKEKAVADEALADAKLASTKGDLALASERQKQLAKRNAADSISLDKMSDKMGRIEEIRQSPFLRIIEPIAGAFSENFSRDKLAEGVSNEAQTLKISGAKDELQASVLRQKSVALQAELEVSAATAGAEGQDVASLAQQIKIGRDSRNELSNLKTEALVTLSMPELDKLVDQGLITPTQLKDQQDTRQLKGVAKSNALLANEMAVVRAQAVRLENTPTEQLKDPKFLAENGFSATQAQDQLRRNSARDTAVQLQTLSLSTAETSAALADLSNKALDDIAKGETENDKVSAPEAQKRLAENQNRSATSAAASARAAREAAAFSKQATADYLANAGLTEARELRDSEVGEDGMITKDFGNGVTMKWTTAEVNNRIRALSAAAVEETVQGAMANAGKKASQTALNQAMMAAGLPVVKGADTDTQLNMLIEDGNLAPASQGKAAQAQALFAMADSTGNAEAAAAAITQASELVLEIHNEKIAAAIAGKSAPEAAAVKNMITNGGKISNQADAVLLLSTSAVSDTTTPSAAYNESLKSLRINALSQDPNKDRATSLAEEFSMKKLSAFDRIEAKTLEAATQHAMGVPIVAAMATASYAAAASALGNEDFAAAIRNGTIFTDTISEVELAQVLFANIETIGFTPQEYLSKLREVTPQAVQEVTEPRGNLAQVTAMASLNQVLFENNITGYAQNLVGDKLQTAIGTVKRQTAPGTIGATRGHEFPSFPKLPNVGPPGLSPEDVARANTPIGSF